MGIEITTEIGSEVRNFGNIDTAVEYLTHRAHENKSAYMHFCQDCTVAIIAETVARVNHVVRPNIDLSRHASGTQSAVQAAIARYR